MNKKQQIDNIIEKIDLIMNSWLSKYHFSARSGGLDDTFNFSWCYDTDEIFYNFLIDESCDSDFEKLCYDYLECRYDVGIFWLSWFHELGHSETYWNLTEAEKNDGLMNLSLWDYFYSPREMAATKWAIDFINQHIEEVKELARDVDALRWQIYNL